VNSFPGAVLAPSPEVSVNRLVRRKVLRQHTPSTSAAVHVEDGVNHMAQGGFPGASPLLGLRQKRGDDIPFRVRQIAWIAHAGYFSMDV